MRVLLSTIGSRGDVQPLLALALELEALGQEVRFCVPPDFRGWIESLGFHVTTIGPEVRAATMVSAQGTRTPLSPEQRQMAIAATVATQFDTLTAAAADCDMLVGATALQVAAPSVAETLGIPYVFGAFAPIVLPSAFHAPPPLSMLGQTPAPPSADYRALWTDNSAHWNTAWGPALNSRRIAAGLDEVADVRSHIFTARPWLAADRTLAPWPEPDDQSVFQTGAWLLPDERPLEPDLEAFLDAGEPPVYFGFGSMRAPQGISEVMMASARALGRRAIISRGWANLTLSDNAAHCLAIDDVNQQRLFRRVAAVVHHGGAGTTTAAARAGAPQVVIPQMYDQYYWAQRVHELGVGAAHAASPPTVDSLTDALKLTLQAGVATRALSMAAAVRGDGARMAAARIVAIGERAS